MSVSSSILFPQPEPSAANSPESLTLSETGSESSISSLTTDLFAWVTPTLSPQASPSLKKIERYQREIDSVTEKARLCRQRIRNFRTGSKQCPTTTIPNA